MKPWLVLLLLAGFVTADSVISENAVLHNNTDGSFSQFISTNPRFMQDANGTWRNVTDVIQATSNNTGVYFSWNSKNKGKGSMSFDFDNWELVNMGSFWKWQGTVSVPKGSGQFNYRLREKEEYQYVDENSFFNKGLYVDVSNLNLNLSDGSFNSSVVLIEQQTSIIAQVSWSSSKKQDVTFDPTISLNPAASKYLSLPFPCTICTSYAFLRFNLSSIPSNVVISDAVFSLFQKFGIYYYPVVSENVSIYNTSFYWTSESPQNTYNAFITANYSNATLLTPFANDTYFWNVTDAARFSYANTKNLSFRLNSSTAVSFIYPFAWFANQEYLYIGNSSSALGAYGNYSVLNNTANPKPMLNITYYEKTNPLWSLNQTNSTQNGTNVMFSVYWTTGWGLANYTFSFDNGEGYFTNNSLASFSGYEAWSNTTKTVNATPGALIRWLYYAWDTNGNYNNTDVFQFNTVPPSGGGQLVTTVRRRMIWNLIWIG